MERAPKSPAGVRRKVPRRPKPASQESTPRTEAASASARTLGSSAEVAAELGALGLSEEAALALHAHVARALEAGSHAGKRNGSTLGKARVLAAKAPTTGLPHVRLIPLILAVRDALKRGAPGGRGSRARDERLDRAADAALRGIPVAAEGTAATPKSPKGGAPLAELTAAREVLQRILSLTPDAVLTIRASGRLGLWNGAASRMLGRRRWEVHRRGLAASFRDRTAHDALMAELEERGRVTRCEVALINAAGEEVSARIYALRLAAPKSTELAPADPDRFLLLFHDLSEVQHIRQRLIETEKLSAMAKIAGSVAHEFRNPLNSLFLSTDLLEDELEGREDVRKSIAPTLAAIREEIERLNQIITHYLSLSKISSASPEMMDLGAVASAFSKEHATRLAADHVELRLRADDGGHDITADPNQVRRILVNLVENAVQAVRGEDPDAEEPTRRGRVTIYVRRMRRSVKITVKDNGPGIPEELRERVFEPFFTSRAGGSGLGLYLVREIALASGGTLTLSSAPGRGTSVSIRWPHTRLAEDAGTAT